MTEYKGNDKPALTACVFNIERFATRDGPGIRTTVFFKGCPLRCLWCSNPESMQPYPQLFYFEHLCQRCGRCVQACPTEATTAGVEGAIAIDRSLCKVCGECVDVCPAKAREISGTFMTVEEILEEVKKDTLFYQNSGGGITASGGEPTRQPEFLRELFRQCQRSSIHTCLDTCGFVQPEVLQMVLEYTNLVLCDIKHMEAKKHKDFTGVDNHLILENIRMMAAQGKPLIIRVPLIPEHNDSEENMKALADFMHGLGLRRIDILPYHGLGKTKYERLGMKYELGELQPHDSEELEKIKAFLESRGLDVGIG